MPAGRPRTGSPQTFVNKITKFSDKIFFDGKVVVKKNPVWAELSASFNGAYTAESLYALVTMDRHGVLKSIQNAKKTYLRCGERCFI